MALANKKTLRKFIKDRTGGFFTSDRITKASSSIANDDISDDINMIDGPMAPVLYHTDLIQEDIDELRRYVTNDISSGGGLTETPLAMISGRWQWSSSDDGERIWVGSTSYGPFNWYNHNQEPTHGTMRRYSTSHVVNTTTAEDDPYKVSHYGIWCPNNGKKVKAKLSFRIQNAPNNSTFGFSIWSASEPDNGLSSNSDNHIDFTLRAVSPSVTVGTNSTTFYKTLTTTTNAMNDVFIFPLLENRTGALSSNTYIYGQLALFLVD